eukprot:753287-Hanusia_phi.AAC.3
MFLMLLSSLLFPHNLPPPARSTSTTSSLPFQASLAMSLTFPAGHQLPNLSATAQAISSHGPQQVRAALRGRLLLMRSRESREARRRRRKRGGARSRTTLS